MSLSVEERVKAVKILRDDFELYARLNLKIKTKSGTIEPLIFNEPQKYIHSKLQEQLTKTGKIRAILLKGRQQGASTYTEGRLYWRTSMAFGKQAYILTHEQAATDNLFGMAKRYHDNCAPEVKPETGAANAKELSFTKLDSGYKVGTAGSRAVGRSGTLQLFHGCLSMGTQLIDGNTKGLKTIESFNIGDKVITHTGNEAEISYISKQEKECKSIVFRTLGKFPLIATNEHKFWTKDGWKELKELSIGDSIGYPVKTLTNEIKALKLPEPAKRLQKGGRQGIYNNTIELDYGFGRVVGLYLAEGYIKLQSKSPNLPSCITYSVHEKETQRTLEWLNGFKDYYSSIGTKQLKDSLTVQVTVNGNRFASLIMVLCGRVSGKHVPHNWNKMPEEFIKGLLHGYISGDGSSYAKDRRIRATSIRSEITLPMRDICASLGYGWASIEHKEAAIRAGRNEKEAFILSLCGNGASKLANEINKDTPILKNKKTASIKNNAALTTDISNGYAWLRIKSIEDAGLKNVYDFEIDHEDHSYCTIHGATHNSEIGFWPNADEHFSGVMQCIPDEPGTEVIIESTANGVGGKFNDLWTKAVNGESEYIAIFVPWFWSHEYRKEAPLNFKPTKEEQAKKALYHVDNDQLNWRRSKVEEMGQDLCDQEYPYCWQDAFLFSGRTKFEKEHLDKAMKECWKPKYRMVLEGNKFVKHSEGELRVWSEPKPGCRYVIGADVAEGIVEGDYSCADVLELPSGQQVAQWHGHIAPDLFGELLNHLGRHYNQALTAVENNNHGLAVNIKLRDSGYPNLYVQRKVDDAYSGEVVQSRIGWMTTSKSKPYIIDELAAELREGTHGIACKETVQEMQTYVVAASGSTNAQLGCWDDRVMSRAIAGYLVRNAYNQ